MTDYCVRCGDATADEAGGEYVEFEPVDNRIDGLISLSIAIERFVCNGCLEEVKVKE